MKARVLTGSKQDIADEVAKIDGEIHEAIVFVEEPTAPIGAPDELFAEMEAFTVREKRVDDSRGAIYRPMVGE